MESFDSSPNSVRATSRFGAKTQNSQGGSEYDDVISVSSSTCGSALNGSYAQKLNNNGTKYRTTNKKTLKSFGNVRSFRRRVKSRVVHSPLPMSDEDSLVDSSHSSPHYLKATTCSEIKKTRSQTSPRLAYPSHNNSLQPLSRTSSFRSVRILVKKNSFRPRRSSRNHSKVSEDVSVDRATYSSTVKDTKFPESVEVQSGGIESEKSSVVKVCRYHHCSLHGHCLGSQDPNPPLKLFLYRRRRSLKKQKSVIPKTESTPVVSDKRKIVPKRQTGPSIEPLNHERIGDMDKNGHGYKDIEDAYHFEVAFGETSFPERSHEDSLNILRKYSTYEQDFGGSSFGRNECCSKCSCHQVTSSSPHVYSKDSPETPDVFDEITEKNSVFSSASYSHTSSDRNSEEEEVEIRTEPTTTTTGDSKGNEVVVQLEDSEMNSPVQKGAKLEFSKPRHISMWHLIQHHMSSNNPVQAADGERPVDRPDTQLAKECTSSNNDSPTQEIELRKMFAIKLVREAIEKILLPEVQDQTSYDQSATSTPRSEPMEKNQSEDSNPKDQSFIMDDASSREVKEAEKQVAKKSEKKAPKHWSNLRKWILLQRFIRELEKVKKFNPRKPQHLPLNPDPESEKVNLRPQTVDERKSAEEWMLDFALRQAVSELAPTQKRKVSLLVKAFETVVPLQEEPQVQFKISRLRDNRLDVGSPGCKVDEPVSSVLIFDSAEQEASIKMKETDVKNCISMDDLPESKEVSPRELNGIHEDMINVTENGTQKQQEEDAISGGQSSQMDRKNYIKTWHMIYQNVVSGIAEKLGSQLLDGSEDDEAEINDFSQPTNSSSNLKGGLTKSNALKLVKEAVDEILLPETQDDSSDAQSVTSEESQTINKDEIPKPKNWIKLKKLLLLRRSIKALEKARELKPPPPSKLLPQSSDNEPEKIELRRPMMDERRKAEQWMLDYAVQHIVTKLTPARKRRVSMLVEAFEAVVPLPEI